MSAKLTAGLGVAALVYVFATPPAALARGLRNNNPGNIRAVTRYEWRGQVGVDAAGFVIFATPQDGIRAMARVLLNYRDRAGIEGIGGAGIDTVREIVNRWAPPVENDTAGYVAGVARRTGIDPDAPIDVAAHLPRLIPAMIVQETGSNPYPASVIAQGIALA